MPKNYEFPENEPLKASDPAVAYHRMPVVEQTGNDSVDWNPNYPVHATQEQWWEHIHEIESGHFMSLEEANQEFEKWEKNYLANRLRQAIDFN